MILKMVFGLENIPKTKKNVIVVVDAFRSSAVINNAFKNGVNNIFLFIDKNQIITQDSISQHIMLCGEKNCLKIKGFDLGNSPLEYNSNVKNKVLLYCSGFGSKALLLSNANYVFLSGFTNAEAMAILLNKKFNNSEIYFVIGGGKYTICMDDFIAAGIIISFLNFKFLDNFCLSSLNLVLQYKDILINIIYNSPSVKNLLELGFSKDVKFCINESFDIIPYKKGNELVKFDIYG